MFRSIILVSTSTLASRVLGVVRDAVMFACLGTSSWSAAFLMAFTLPNLFRRLLGEGALTSAVIPVFANIKDNAQSEDLLNRLLSFLSLGLFVLSLGFLGLITIIQNFEGLPSRFYQAAELSYMLIFYMPLICLAAIIGARLNQKGLFSAGAIAPICLNLSMVAALGIAYVLNLTQDIQYVWMLSIGVMIGGVLQLAWPFFSLKRTGWKFEFKIGECSFFQEIRKLFIPAAFAAAIFQLNLLVSRLLAFSFNDSALSLLYLAGRLVELPTGIFTLAVTTVIFPELAHVAAQKDTNRLSELYAQGVQLVLLISLPAMMGLIALADPILQALFQWGALKNNAIQEAIPILQASALTIPLYAWSTISTRVLHAEKNTRGPLRISILSFILNSACSIILMQFLGLMGLVIANIIATACQAICLHHLCQKQLHSRFAMNNIWKMLIASALMGIVVYYGHHLWATYLGESKLHLILSLCILIPIGIFIYFAPLFKWMPTEEIYLLKRFLTLKKKTSPLV